MSSVGSAEHAHEIIIVKHGGGDHEDGHHGGAWKIAFADFMTAMMCFFLVMWLINAANEQTQTAVASYFNPVKLIDRNSSRKGLDDMGDKPADFDGALDKPKGGGEKPAETDKTDKPAEQKTASQAGDPDARLFADPYAVLDEIAASAPTQQNAGAEGESGAQAAASATSADGEKSFRDPFAPDFWSQQMEAATKPGEKPVEADTRTAQSEDIATSMADLDMKPSLDPSQARPQQDAKPTEQPETGKAQQASKAIEAEAKEIEKQLKEALGEDKLGEGLTITATPEGVLISLTEDLNFGMFAIGSAVPSRDLVLAMEKIGKVLANHPGPVVVNGHTDGRPFHNEKYDNWRLSTARAQAAFYMLARGGLGEARIVEVSGYADRKLKKPDDPLAAANRRIEILLEKGG